MKMATKTTRQSVKAVKTAPKKEVLKEYTIEVEFVKMPLATLNELLAVVSEIVPWGKLEPARQKVIQEAQITKEQVKVKSNEDK